MSTVPPPDGASGAPNPEPHFERSYDLTAPARAALRKKELLPVNLDVPHTASIAIGTAERVVPLRDEIVASLPRLDIADLDNLRAYGEALFFAQVSYRTASRPPAPLPALAADASRVRSLLQSGVATLVAHGLLDGTPLDELKGGTGYLNLATDVGVLAKVLRDRWDAVGSKIPVERADLAEADRIVTHLVMAYAERSKQPEKKAAARDARQRAYTLVLRSYEEVRHAVAYLRRHQGDGEKLAPSLWEGRGKRGGRKAEEQAPHPGEGAGVKTEEAGQVGKGGAEDGVAGGDGHAGGGEERAVATGRGGGSPFSTQ